MLRRLWLKLGTFAFWVCWPALYVYLHHSRRTRIVVRAGGQLLLVRSWLSDGRWGLPGGGLHRNEPANAGAARELSEETGVTIPPESLVELTTEQLIRRGLSFTCTYFLADLEQAGEPQKQRLEISDAQWFHTSQMGTYEFQSEVRHALKLLAERGLF